MTTISVLRVREAAIEANEVMDMLRMAMARVTRRMKAEATMSTLVDPVPVLAIMLEPTETIMMTMTRVSTVKEATMEEQM